MTTSNPWQWIEELKVGDKVAVRSGNRYEYGIATVVERSTRKNAKTKVVGVSYCTNGTNGHVIWFDHTGHSSSGGVWGRNSIEPVTDRVRESIKLRKLKSRVRTQLEELTTWLRDVDSKDIRALETVTDHLGLSKQAAGIDKPSSEG